MDWLEQGMDFADALHLARTTSCDAFVTFDRRLSKRSIALGALPDEVV
jgi:predicted nucleic-acid-binding protein